MTTQEKIQSAISEKVIILNPVKGCDKLVLHYIADKGWLWEFFKGKNLGGVNRYLVCGNIVISGYFTALGMVSKLPTTSFYALSEDDMILMVTSIHKDDFQQLADKAICPQNEMELLDAINGTNHWEEFNKFSKKHTK